jgi:hypothetical protein
MTLIKQLKDHAFSPMVSVDLFARANPVIYDGVYRAPISLQH